MNAQHLPLSRSDELTWALGDIDAKLKLRAALPGASIFDRIQSALIEAELPFASRLAFALSGSWMVNNKVSSPVFQVWLQPGAVTDLEQLTRALQTRTQREAAVAIAEKLLSVQSTPLPIVALSKVIALLAPAEVPLLDDAAIAWLTNAFADPGSDISTAGPEHLWPAMDAFAAALDASELGAAAAAHGLTYPAQVLDRLLWFDSFGHRHFDGWAKIESATTLEVKKLR